ncbi:hypothetical protein BH10ACT7_BH10ACT7_07330 [soil metagenome]
MRELMALQGAAPWLLVVGTVVLTLSVIAYYRWEALPIGPNRALIWTGVAFLLLGLLAWVAPYIVLFLSARPA